MYSVVMMAALSTGGGVETVGWNGCNGCGGCSGCYGYTAGWGCNGCNGCRGGCAGAFLGATHSRWGCHGCAGSCYGAGRAVQHGGCQGASYGCTGCFGSTPAVTPYRVLEHRSAKPEELKPKPKPEPGGIKPGTLAPNRARILVELPSDARLYIDDQLTMGANGVRSFTTPELAAAQDYFYDVRAELVRDGEVVARASERVIFRPGEEKRLTLREVAFRPVPTKATAKQ